MTKPEHDSEAVRAYRRTLGEVAETRVVATAEDILTDAWIDELERFRTVILGVADSARRADRAAREEVHEAQTHGTPEEIARAHRHLASVAAERSIDFEEARRLLDALDEELEVTCLAGIERARRGKEDHARLRAAWRAAYGRGERDGGG
jgi:hypothetical protein